jgi:hypothetical protein
MNEPQQPQQPQIDAQALVDSLVAQRNDALNHCASLQALLIMKDKKIAELEKRCV